MNLRACEVGLGLDDAQGHQPDFWGHDQALSSSPNLHEYERIIVAFSGGKDSVACVLHLLECGVPPSRIHLHHHLVDGRGEDFMDWICTESYCNAFAKALDLQISYSWKVRGFEGEMTRNKAPTAPTAIPFEGGYREVGGQGNNGTRLKFPQVSASLTTRWCSAYLKISVMDSWIKNDPKFLIGKTLVVTGERAQESSSRAKYRMFEPHRSDNRFGTRVKRHVDHWRPVHQWTEQQVWAIMERFRIVAHPAYYLGFGRCSCVACVFGNKNQWATVKVLVPKQYRKIAQYEQSFGVTIHRSATVEQLANAGTPYELDPFWVEVANSREFSIPIITDNWTLPSGAYGDQQCGPS